MRRPARYTLAAWVNGTDWNDWRTVFEFGDDAPWFGVTSGGSLALYPVIFGGTIPAGTWTHVAYTWTGTENRLYVNGMAVAANQAPPPGNGQGVVMGFEINNISPWSGLLDDARVDNRGRRMAKSRNLPARKRARLRRRRSRIRNQSRLRRRP